MGEWVVVYSRNQSEFPPCFSLTRTRSPPTPQQGVKHGLMTSLILAYGIMILQDGLFHSDP